jgi:hypothetical protein
MFSSASPARRLGRTLAVAGLLIASTVSGCRCGEVRLLPLEGGLVVNPTSYAFGPIAVGTIKSVSFQLTNRGRGSVTVSSIALQTDSADLAVTDILTTDCKSATRSGTNLMTLEGNECAQFTVRYGPHAQTPVADTVLIRSNDPKNPVIKVPLTGTGVAGTIRVCQLVPGTNGAAPTVDMTTCIPGAMPVPPLQFGALQPGGSFIREVRIYNDGMYELAINQAQVQGMVPDFAVVGGNNYSGTIQPGASVDLQVKYTAETQGSNTANLVIPSTDPVNPELTIPITGEELGPKLCINPTSLDFGTIPVGTTRTLSVTLTNCGEADYDLTQLELINNNPAATVFTSPAAGAAGAIPTIPDSFPVGSTLTLNVTYAPTVEEMPPAPGDSGFFSIITGVTGTSYQRATVPITGRGGFPGCNSTSGGTSLTPTAAIQVLLGTTPENPATFTFSPLSQVTLVGSGTVPSGSGETITSYTWRLVSQPTGSVASLTGSGARVGLYMEVIGDYVVELVVNTNEMCQSAPVQVTLVVNSSAGIHVQLTWPQTYGDVDLHYIGPGGKLYETSPNKGDLDWNYSQASAYGPGTPTPNCGGILGSCANLSPDWGKNNMVQPDGTHADDASLDLDQRWGNGPENVTHPMPFDGTYKVSVHYYCEANESGTSFNPTPYGNITAVVKIFSAGTLLWSGQMPNMSEEQVWDAAEIVVSNNGSTVTVTPLTTALYKISEGCNSI